MEEKTKLFDGFPPVSTAEWEAQINADLKGADYEKKLIWKTYEGIAVRPYYRSENTPSDTAVPNMPGNWEIRQDIPEDQIVSINSTAKEIANKGAEGIGLNCTNVRTAEDISRLLDGIDLTRIAIHITNCSDYPEFLNLLINYVQVTGIDASLVKGSLNFDPFYGLLTSGQLSKPVGDLISDAIQMLNAGKFLPEFRILAVHGNLFHEAGASITQELAYSLAISHEYLYLLTLAGVDAGLVLKNLQIILSTGSNYFMEIAKLRAIRLLWSQLADQYGNPSARLQLQVTSSRWNKTIYDPHVNMLRSTTEAMSAAIGGADVIQIDAFDAVYSKPDEFSMRLARNQQIILKEESWLNKVIDPSAGSYYIENLTHLLADTSWQMFRSAESKGGFQEIWKSGFLADDIEMVAKQRLLDMANRKTIVLGTNQYPNTLEKISVSTSFADQTDIKTSGGLKFFRLSGEFEKMRQRTGKFEVEKGKGVNVFLFSMGNLAMRKARAMFSTNFFGCAGFKVIDNQGFNTVEEGIEAWKNSGAEILVICSSDEEYADFVPGLCKQLNNLENAPLIIMAGYPKEQIDFYKAAGVHDFIHVRSNVLTTLTNYQVILGM